MEKSRFESIKRHYGDHASWAFWRMPINAELVGAEVNDLSVFAPYEPAELFQTLHTRFVLLGLNVSRVSGTQIEPFRNFHDESPKGRDYRLRYAIHGTPLWGAYITDFFVGLVDPNAQKVMAYARENPKEVDRQINDRKDELNSVGADDAVLVALGNAVHRLLKKHFSDRKIIKIPHYAAYYKLKDYRDRVLNVLQSEGY